MRDIRLTANKLLRKAHSIQASSKFPNPLDGMKNAKAKREVDKILGKYSKGFFKDQHWKPIHETINALNSIGIPAYIDRSEYKKDKDGKLTSKEWRVEAPFIDERGREKIIHIIMVASGAGSVKEPLDRYDVVSYVTHIK